jgi:hypothetical protein
MGTLIAVFNLDGRGSRASIVGAAFRVVIWRLAVAS